MGQKASENIKATRSFWSLDATYYSGDRNDSLASGLKRDRNRLGDLTLALSRTMS